MRIKTLLLLLILGAPGPLLAQAPAPPEVQICASVVVAFADGHARVARKNTAAIEPVLVVANLLDTPDTVTITVHPASGAEALVRQVSLGGKRRATVDLTALIGRVDLDFFLEVAFEAFGVADLKMWSGGHATPAAGVTLCR